jgi:hypothetical protein
MKFGSIRAAGQVVATGSIVSNTTALLTGSGQLANLGYATTGSNTFVGTQTMSGSILPAVTNTYDLGSPTQQFRHVYISSGSLYVNGTKVLGSTAQELQITTDVGQSFKILESGSDTITLQSADGNITLASSGGGDVILDPNTGVIALKGTTTVYAGNKIVSSDGNNIQVGNSLTVSGSLVVTNGITAQQLTVQTISSSVEYSSGSNVFGNTISNTHQFTGSVLISGSISVPSSTIHSGSYFNGISVVSGSAQIDVMSTTNIARLATTGSNTFNGLQIVNGNLAIGTSSPNYTATGRTVTALDGSTSALYALQNTGTSVGYVYGDASSVVLWAEGSRNLTVGVASAGNVYLKTNNTVALTINSSQAATFASSVTANGLTVSNSGNAYLQLTAGNTGGSEAGIFFANSGNKWELYTAANDSNISFYSYAASRILLSVGSTGYLTSTSTNSFTSANYDVWNFLAPNQTGGALSFNIGQSLSTYNNAALKFHYVGNSNSSNYLGLGFYDRDNILNVLASGNVGINTSTPSYALEVNGSIRVSSTNAFRGSGVFHGNVNSNIGGNLGYVLLCRLDVDSGWIARGTIVCASWTCWNVTDIYLRKAYASTSVTATVTGVAKGGGQDMAVIDCNYGGSRYLALKFSGGNGEIDVNLTGFGIDTYMTYVSSITSENSTLASY